MKDHFVVKLNGFFQQHHKNFEKLIVFNSLFFIIEIIISMCKN